MLSAMRRTVQAVGVVILGFALLALTIQVTGGQMWQELAEKWMRLSFS